MNPKNPKDIDGAEISWFAPLCNGDDDFLGNRNPSYKSNWYNTKNIVEEADKLGYKNILCPSSYQVGQDTLTFIAGMAPLTKEIIFVDSPDTVKNLFVKDINFAKEVVKAVEARNENLPSTEAVKITNMKGCS